MFPLHHAAYSGKFSIISEEKNAESLNQKTTTGKTLLCVAFEASQWKVVEHLLQNENFLFSYRNGANWQSQFGLDYCKDITGLTAQADLLELYQKKFLSLADTALSKKDENHITDAALLCLGLIHFYNKNKTVISQQLKSTFGNLSTQIKSPFLQNLVFLHHVWSSDVYQNDITCACRFTEMENLTDNQASDLAFYLNKASFAYHFATPPKFPEALSYAQQALKMQKTIKSDAADHDSALANYEDNVGMAYEMINPPNLPEALKHHHEAIKILTKTGSEPDNRDKDRLSSYHFRTALVCEKISDWQSALDHFHHAITMMMGINTYNKKNMIQLAHMHYKVAMIYEKKSAWQKALDRYQQAINIQKQIKEDRRNESNLAANQLSAGIMYVNLNNLDLAKQYFMESYFSYTSIASKNIKDHYYLAYVLLQIGKLYKTQNPYAWPEMLLITCNSGIQSIEKIPEEQRSPDAKHLLIDLESHAKSCQQEIESNYTAPLAQALPETVLAQAPTSPEAPVFSSSEDLQGFKSIPKPTLIKLATLIGKTVANAEKDFYANTKEEIAADVVKNLNALGQRKTSADETDNREKKKPKINCSSSSSSETEMKTAGAGSNGQMSRVLATLSIFPSSSSASSASHLNALASLSVLSEAAASFAEEDVEMTVQVPTNTNRL